MTLPELFKVTKTRYVNAAGKRCNRTVPGAIKQMETLGDWYADIKPIESAAERIARRKAGQPAPKRRRVKLCRDKRAAQEMLRKIVEQGDKQAAGLTDFHAYANQSLGPMVDDFHRHLKASGLTDDYIEMTLGRVQNVFHECQFLRLIDTDCMKVEQWLFERRHGESTSDHQRIRGTANTYQGIADKFGVSVSTVTYWRRKGAPITPRQPNALAPIAKWHAEFTKPTPRKQA